MNTLAKQSFFGIILFLLSCAVQATTVFYFPANYSGTGSPANVTGQAAFSPICDAAGGTSRVRLAGLDMVRGFAGTATCPATTTSNRFSSQPEYVFLIDDTTELSDYLKTQMRQKNALQTIAGREVIKPAVLNFPSDATRQGFKILVVGEVAYTSARINEAGWYAAVNARFAAEQTIAGGAGTNDIWFAYHGMYFDRAGNQIEEVSIEKIAEFVQKQLQDLGAALSSIPVPTAAPSLPAPPPLPSRPLNDYMRQCHNELVPLPPVWNPTSGTSRWQRRGTVPNPFAAPGLARVEVWTFSSTSPEGICFALPRMAAGGNINTGIEALGIICQSKQSGKACFWDNVQRPAGAPGSGQTDETVRRPINRPKITGAATRNLDPVNMSDGYNLEENCTMCHRGSNVFLVQDGTPLDTHSEMPNARYQPVSGTPASPTWANPVSSIHPLIEAASPDSQCTSCHDLDNEIPELTGAFCNTVLRCSIGVNMPPGSPSGWASGYADEVMALSLLCCTNMSVDLGLSMSGNQLNPQTASCVRDSDGDRVRDALDRCPETPAGTTTNTAGCSSTQTPRPRCAAPTTP